MLIGARVMEDHIGYFDEEEKIYLKKKAKARLRLMKVESLLTPLEFSRYLNGDKKILDKVEELMPIEKSKR